MEYKESVEATSGKLEIAKILYSIFLNGLEARYKEILGFWGFLLPSMTGFIYLLTKYYDPVFEGNRIALLFFGSTMILLLLTLGAVYSLSISYRYRYLQASVYKIESYFGCNVFIPESFKPSPIKSIKDRLLFDIAPLILQIYVIFFCLCILGVTITFISITSWSLKSYLSIILCALSLFIIFVFGGWILPNKVNKIINLLE